MNMVKKKEAEQNEKHIQKRKEVGSGSTSHRRI